GELALRRLEARTRDVERLPRRLALALHLRALRLERGDPSFGLAQLRLQRVELEERALGAGGEALVRRAEAGHAVACRGIVRTRPRRSDEEGDGGKAEDREPSRTLLAT